MPKVRDAIRFVESHGWRWIPTRGSHRHFVHPECPGLVTIAGKPSRDLAAGTWRSILRQAGIEPQDEP
ncbi:MAG: type II toxin-antitoxin system HicA family toxin [Chloroflexota bacterium]|nr:type II toxin-antitoxin system HicA family toxin [Chloroflexota bacterium]